VPAASTARERPKDVPPPTPINFPRYATTAPAAAAAPDGAADTTKNLPALLQKIVRPTEVLPSHLEALGVHVIPNVPPSELIPDLDLVPDFEAWHELSPDDVHNTNESTRRPLNTGTLSPGCQAYLDRRRELSIPNTAAFRAVRRVPPPKGQSQARLGNSFEFFRHLELFSAFWEDTSQPPAAADKAEENDAKADAAPSDGTATNDADPSEFKFWRTGSGTQMPPEYRQNIVTAFLKLVAYDYGCNVSAPRTEPRLYLNSKSSSSPSAGTPDAGRTSYFSSGCTFIFRTPRTREAARAGIVEGPLVAVSARHSTVFSADQDRDSLVDLSRELIAALITAQHRAREGRTEKRVGEGEWWTTKPRWGGGPGGPIGREVEMEAGLDETVGDKDAPPSAATPPAPRPEDGASRLNSRLAILSGGPGSSSGSGFVVKSNNKRAKKSGGTLPMYDNYRMVRPPAATWDKKTQYASIGRRRGVDYDDVFVVSALFHHVSILRVRVPDRLLAVLEGTAGAGSHGPETWGGVEVKRSRWFDLFQVDDRVEGMQLVWTMVSFLMRKDDDPVDDKDTNTTPSTATTAPARDVNMTDV
jgi:hypothetical protein